MIVAVASRKASPGVTTLASLLAGFWREESVTRLILEADPSGGTLAARWQQAHDLSWDPGLVALSVTRGILDTTAVARVTQEIGDGLRIAAAPPSPAQVTSALRAMGDGFAASLAATPDLRCVVDCGRLTMSSPAMPLAQRAAMTILVCRPVLEEIHTLLPGVVELREAGCMLGLVVVGDGPYHPAEIAEKAEIELLGHLPFDARAAQAWSTDGLHAGRGFRRSDLARTMADLTALVADRCAQVIVPDALLAEPESGAGDEDALIIARPGPIGFAKLLEDSNTAPAAEMQVAPAEASTSDALSSNGVHRG